MANKKDKFDLSKGKQHDFDLTKSSKHKFDLTKDVPENRENISRVSSQGENTNVCNPENTNSNRNKTRRLILISVLVALLAILTLWIIFAFNGENIKQVDSNEDSTIVIDNNTMTDEDTSTSLPTQEDAKTSESEENGILATEKGDKNSSEASTQPNNASDKTPIQTSNVAVSNEIEIKAKDVIRGKYGNGNERKNALGNRYPEIQSRVNQLMKSR